MTATAEKPVIMRHTRRVEVIGGRNNWRTNKPYRPTVIEADPKPWRLKLFVVFAIAVVMIGGLTK